MSSFERLDEILSRITDVGKDRKQTVIPLHRRVVDSRSSFVTAKHLPDVQDESDLVKLGDEERGDVGHHRTLLERQVVLSTKQEKGQPSANTVCHICKGAGRLRRDVPFGHPDFGRDFACVCLERETREKRQRKMVALCEHFGFQRTQTLSTFRYQVRGVKEAYQEAWSMIDRLQAWAKQREAIMPGKDVLAPSRMWLIFRGPVGTGKTHLAMAIANACLDAGIATLFAIVPDLLDYLRATYSPDADVVYDELFTLMKEMEVLVLDDLGSQQSKPWADEKIFQIINHRYNWGRPTVITLNKKRWSRLDERIQSRLQDAGLVLTVNLEGAQDYRLLRRRNVVRRRIPSTAEKRESDY